MRDLTRLRMPSATTSGRAHRAVSPRFGTSPSTSNWFVLLALTDAYIGVQVFRLANEKPVKHAWPLGVIMALSGAMVGHVSVWLTLSALEVGGARYIGYATALIAAVAGFVGGRKLALKDTRAKYSAIHGLVAALLMFIVILVVARPFQQGGPTLGT